MYALLQVFLARPKIAVCISNICKVLTTTELEGGMTTNLVFFLFLLLLLLLLLLLILMLSYPPISFFLKAQTTKTTKR